MQHATQAFLLRPGLDWGHGGLCGDGDRLAIIAVDGHEPEGSIRVREPTHAYDTYVVRVEAL